MPAKINYRVDGSGDITLMFVHGFGCDLSDWDTMVGALSSEFRCVRLDLPGHGLSPIGTVSSIEGLARAVNWVKDEAGGDRTILIGHSLGAKIVRQAYCRSPDKITGLVMIDGAYYEADPVSMRQARQQEIDRDGFAAFARRHFESLFVANDAAETRARVVERALRLESEFGRDVYLDAVGWDHTESKRTLKAIRVPILGIYTSRYDDTWTRVSLTPTVRTPLMQVTEALVRGAKSIVLADCGHFPMYDRPEALAGLIREFAVSVKNNNAGASRIDVVDP
jgi:pimeloyl-ACP methyl ester carboxylesterase